MTQRTAIPTTGDELRAYQLAGLSEDEFLRQALAEADRLKLLAYHTEDSSGCCHRCGARRRADRRGFPDLIVPVPPVLHLFELKSARGILRPEQKAWGEALLRCREIDYRVLRPSDYQALSAALEGS